MRQEKAKFLFYIKKNVKLKDTIKMILMLIQLPIFLCAYVVAKLTAKKHTNIWLIGEMGIDAKDNGMEFFLYLNKTHPEINSVYYISGNSEIVKKVQKVGKTVRTNSFKHKVLFLSARYVLSTQDGYAIPFKGVNWREFKTICGWLSPNIKYVFLNHGVNKDDIVETSNYGRTKFDYYVTTTKAEYQEMSSYRYGYPEGCVIQTGLARYDELQNKESRIKKRKQILFMPTWRYYLADVNNKQFINSRYFKVIYSFLHSEILQGLLNKANIKMYFFPPHHEIKKRMFLFDLENTVIEPLDIDRDNFSNALLEASMLITDYSSVAFDFAYLYKKTVYYQFDLEEYRRGQYKEGYFKYDRDGFGPIISNEKDLLREINNAVNHDFEIENKYRKRINRTFDIYDNKNSERLFNILI